MAIDCAEVLAYLHVKQLDFSDKIFKCGLVVCTWYHIPIRFFAKNNVTVLAVIVLKSQLYVVSLLIPNIQ